MRSERQRARRRTTAPPPGEQQALRNAPVASHELSADCRSHAPNLFDVTDLTDTPKVRDLKVAPVPQADVTEFCRRYHYTHHGGSMSWRYGLWHGPTLLGVVSYNLPTRVVCAAPFGPDGIPHVWHMGRLVCAPQAPPNSESRLIGGSLKLIARHHDVWAVVTYADTSQGHIGYVYQATNALYTGPVIRPRIGGGGYIDAQGRLRSSVNGGDSVSPAKAAVMGWTPVPPAYKHRYVYLLGDRKWRVQLREALRWPVLPYPKGDMQESA